MSRFESIPDRSMHTNQCSLNQQDRDLLKSAGGKVSTHAGIASLAGLGLGVYLAFRLRAMRVAYFNAFRTMEKPVEVRFADGRTGELIVCTVRRVHKSDTVRRTHPRYLSEALAIEMGRCGNVRPLLYFWIVPWWRDWTFDGYCIGIANDNKGPCE
jgi:hypothetical protein